MLASLSIFPRLHKIYETKVLIARQHGSAAAQRLCSCVSITLRNKIDDQANLNARELLPLIYYTYNIHLSRFKRFKEKGHISLYALFPSNASIYLKNKTQFSFLFTKPSLGDARAHCTSSGCATGTHRFVGEFKRDQSQCLAVFS